MINLFPIYMRIQIRIHILFIYYSIQYKHNQCTHIHTHTNTSIRMCMIFSQQYFYFWIKTSTFLWGSYLLTDGNVDFIFFILGRWEVISCQIKYFLLILKVPRFFFFGFFVGFFFNSHRSPVSGRSIIFV